MKLASAIVGGEAGPLELVLEPRWVMAYSAGLGETDARYYDTTTLDRLWVHPLFPVSYEWPVSQPLRSVAPLRAAQPRLVHAEHDLVIHRPLRAGETVRTFARVVSAQQRSPGAFVVFRYEARSRDDEPITTSDFGALYRGVELDGAPRTIAELGDPPPPHGALSPIGQIAVSATAAHVYSECARIWNPIHTDIAYARAAGLPTIILHGTATLALSVSRLLSAFTIAPLAVRRVRCRFSGMVPMPATLSVHASREGDALAFETRNERGEPVITRAQLLLQ